MNLHAIDFFTPKALAYEIPISAVLIAIVLVSILIWIYKTKQKLDEEEFFLGSFPELDFPTETLNSSENELKLKESPKLELSTPTVNYAPALYFYDAQKDKPVSDRTTRRYREMFESMAQILKLNDKSKEAKRLKILINKLKQGHIKLIKSTKAKK